MISFDDIDWTSPTVLKAAGGAALWLLSDSRALRMAGVGLVAWAGWDWYQARPKVIYQSVPLPKALGQAVAPWSHPAPANLGKWS